MHYTGSGAKSDSVEWNGILHDHKHDREITFFIHFDVQHQIKLDYNYNHMHNLSGH
jgi:hypothetical protein